MAWTHPLRRPGIDPKTGQPYKERPVDDARNFEDQPIKIEVVVPNPMNREFVTGATRDLDDSKLDFEGFIAPDVAKLFALYMHINRKMPDGTKRDSDNWQKGIPIPVYHKSLVRHFFNAWSGWRSASPKATSPHYRSREAETLKDLMAVMFNVQGLVLEMLKDTPGIDTDAMLGYMQERENELEIRRLEAKAGKITPLNSQGAI